MNRILHILLLGACLALASCARQESRTLTFSSEDDLAGLRVATVAGCCYDLSLSKRNDIELLLYSFDADVLQALLNGKADVMVHDERSLSRGRNVSPLHSCSGRTKRPLSIP